MEGGDDDRNAATVRALLLTGHRGVWEERAAMAGTAGGAGSKRECAALVD